MIHQWSKIIGTPVLSYAEGTALAVIQDVVIHPDTGKIEAFWVKPLTVPIRHGILLADDIVAWKKNLYIKDERVIAEPEDVIRVSDILSRRTYFIGNKVKGESGKVYGRVFDLDFDDKTLYLRYLFAHRSFLYFKYKPCFFHFDGVIQVLPEFILVKEEAGKKEAAKESELIQNNHILSDA